jgi:hypothetical protein
MKLEDEESEDDGGIRKMILGSVNTLHRLFRGDTE